jgi:hypothetical protein
VPNHRSLEKEGVVPNTNNIFWGLVCALVLVVGLIVGRMGFVGRTSTAPSASNFREDFSFTLVRDKTFKNQDVDVDGNEFINCTFENVVFKFAGNAPFRFVTDHFGNGTKLGVGSDNRPIQAAIELTAAIMKVNSAAQTPPRENK